MSRTRHHVDVAGGLTVIRPSWSGRFHDFVTSHRGLVLLLAAVDTLVAGYLLLTPGFYFAAEDTWAGALDVVAAAGLTPSTAPLGMLLGLVAVGTWCGVLGVPWIARLSLLLALAPWGLIATSFAVAWMQTRIGFMTATLSGAVVVLHLASVGHFPPGRRP
ncbi:hypothetical protein [Kineococcus terrestris]|uniref:hypothetical protein n=1 Tax=Kineococcus terrestris TaxID=2044856 RepID=UPI0034DB3F59